MAACWRPVGGPLAPSPRLLDMYHHNLTHVLTARRVVIVAAAVAALATPSAAMAVPTAEPGEPTCQAAIISYAVQVGTGRREAAEFFFGDYPQAVQTAQRAVQDFCN